MTTLAARIVEKEKLIVALKDDLLARTNELEAAPDEESLVIAVEELTDKIDKADAELGALKKAEKVLAARSTSETAAVVKSQHLEKNQPKNSDDITIKRAAASFIAFVQRKSVAQVMQERYGDCDYLKAADDYIMKTAVPLATTTGAGWAAELVRSDTRGFIESIQENSVAAALAAQAIQLDFDGFNSIKVPRELPGPAVPTEPAWVGEGGVIPLTSFSFGSQELFRYKLAAIAQFSEELAERSSPAIEERIRIGLRKAYAKVLDNALLSVLPAVLGVRPAGLLYDTFAGAPVATLAPTAGGGEDAVRGDITKLLMALPNAVKPVLLLNKLDALAAGMMVTPLSTTAFPELSRGTLFGMPVIVSGHVQQHRAIIVDADVLATAFDAPAFLTSNVATVTEANADGVAPTQAMTGAGAVGTPGQVLPNSGIRVSQDAATPAAAVGYTARSYFQTYSVGVRMIAPTTWGVLAPAAVAQTFPTTWTP